MSGEEAPTKKTLCTSGVVAPVVVKATCAGACALDVARSMSHQVCVVPETTSPKSR
jgi:hypothetical protein